MAGGVTWSRQVMPTRSHLSQVELPVTFGLGKAARVDAVQVFWPGQTVPQTLGSLAVDRVHVIQPPRRVGAFVKIP